MSILITALLVVYTIICVLMVLVVLMQRPRSEGLGAAFGGGMTENLFGAQTTNVLQKFTVWLGISFFVLTLLLAMLYARTGDIKPSIQKQLMQPGEVSETAPAVLEEPPKSLDEPVQVTLESTPAPAEETLLETGTVDLTTPAPAPAAEAEPTPEAAIVPDSSTEAP